MRINKVIIVFNHGQDRVTLETDLPPVLGGYPTLELQFETLPGKARDYARQHFSDSVIETVDAKSGRVEMAYPDGRLEIINEGHR